MAAINNDWLEALEAEFHKPYYKQLFATVNQEYKTRLIFPPADGPSKQFLNKGIVFPPIM